MGTTPAGLPYPEGTDFVMDGDDAIKALATAIRIKQGAVFVPKGTATGGVSVAVTYPAGIFSSTPLVVGCANSSSITVGVSTLSPTGFVLTALQRGAAGDLNVFPGANCYWIATQIP